jgi:hypothetical protein
MTSPTDTHSPARWPIVELRQYTLHAGRRDELITLFDREFIATQEALGMQVLAQFRDLDDADRFIWLRGFADMASRAKALEAFYGGPVWQAHRGAANATMIDSDNVLLLRPAVTADAAEPIDAWQRKPVADAAAGGALIAVFCLRLALAAETAETLSRTLAGVLERAGGTQAGAYVTEASPNNFPRLPVREGERVFVWIARFEDTATRDRLAAELDASPFAPSQVLRLQPTSRSRF